MDKPPSDSAKTKALFLSPESPYPAIGGGPLRSASLLEYLSQRFSVHAIIFREPGAPDPARAIPPGLVAKVDVIDLPHHSRDAMSRVLRNSLRVVRNRPPLMDRFSGFASRVAALVSGNRYDAAVVEHFWCAPYLDQLRPHAQRVILDLHNIESVWFEREAAFERGPRSWALARFAKSSGQLEREWLPKFDVLLAASARDAERVEAAGRNVVVYPNALPLIPPPPRADREGIVFSGNLEYAPNISAIRFFRDRIWPLLRPRWPDLRWKLIGKNPEAIAGLLHGHPRIELIGFVEDAIALLAAGLVAVVPVVSGSGTRIKILEAWAAGTPVVSTALGAEGLDARDGEHLLLADEPNAFAAAVSRLLASPEERARIGAAGRRLYEDRYTWPVVWRNLDSLF